MMNFDAMYVSFSDHFWCFVLRKVFMQRDITLCDLISYYFINYFTQFYFTSIIILKIQWIRFLHFQKLRSKFVHFWILNAQLQSLRRLENLMSKSRLLISAVYCQGTVFHVGTYVAVVFLNKYEFLKTFSIYEINC